MGAAGRAARTAVVGGVAAAAALALVPAGFGAALPLPTQVAALGDSISAGWGSGTNDAGQNVPGVNIADSWSTGDAPAVGSHYLRLLGEVPASATITAVNLAQPGASIADPAYGMAAQAREVPAGTGYVFLGGGTADVCVPAKPAQLLSSDEFRTAFRAGLQTLRSRLPGVHVFVASIPNWYTLWTDANLRDRPRPDYACPLIFGAESTDSTAAAFEHAISDYNADFAEVCGSDEFSSMCDFDGGAAHGLILHADDLSSVDWFHLSAHGQARLAAATWGASPFNRHPGKAAIPAAPVAPVPNAPAPKPEAKAPAPSDSDETRGIALVSASVDVDRAAVLRVIVVYRHTTQRLPLLKGSKVGVTTAAAQRPAIWDHGKGAVAIRLRISARALKGHLLAIQVSAHARGGTTTLNIPFVA